MSGVSSKVITVIQAKLLFYSTVFFFLSNLACFWSLYLYPSPPLNFERVGFVSNLKICVILNHSRTESEKGRLEMSSDVQFIDAFAQFKGN